MHQQKEQSSPNQKISRENEQELVKERENNDFEDGSVDSGSCHQDIESDEVLYGRGSDWALRAGNRARSSPGRERGSPGGEVAT